MSTDKQVANQIVYDKIYKQMEAPIDIVGGANVRTVEDFCLTTPLPLMWKRSYNTTRLSYDGPFGWGHTHEYDRQLKLTINGFSYINFCGDFIEFPHFQKGETSHIHLGMILQQVSQKRYRLFRNDMVMEFEFADDVRIPAKLRKISREDDFLSFCYSPSGLLESIESSSDVHISVESNAEGRISGLFREESKNKKKRTLATYEYDADGNLILATDPYKNAFRYRYRNRRMVRETDRRGYSFLFEYDDKGRCVHSRGEDGVRDLRLRYLKPERTTVVTMADGGEWTYIYDANGAVLQIIDPYGGVESFVQDDQGNIVEETDANGNKTEYIYSSGGMPLTTVSPLGCETPFPKPQLAFDPLDHHIADSPVEWEFGLLLTEISLPREKQLLEIPASLLDLVKTRPTNADPGPVYNEFGLLLKEIDIDGNIRQWCYDPGGNIIRDVDYENSVYRYRYQSWNHLCTEINPLGNEVSYQYTAHEKISAVVNANSTHSEYRYDLKGRLVEIIRCGVLKDRYKYDKADNLVEKYDGKGNLLLSLEYGPGNLKKTRRLASGENHYFEYDQLGRFTRAATDDFEVTFAYDDFGHRVEDKRNVKGVEHEFDGPELLRTTIFDHFTITYRHEINGSVTICDPTGKKHKIRIIGSGIVSREFSGVFSEISQYGPQENCIFKATSFATGTTWARRYDYSPEGDLVATRDSEVGDFHYSYDAAHRLSQIELPCGEKQGIVYDNAGNILQMPGLSGVTLRQGNRLCSANCDEFEYNDRNHISLRKTLGGDIHYRYDSRDMLLGIETPKMSWQARYDPLGRRTEKKYGIDTIEYYWDTDRLVAEISQNGSLRIYIYPDAFSLVPLMFIDYHSIDSAPASGKCYFPLHNQISTPIRVVDETGKIVWQAYLDPYGSAHVSIGKNFHMPSRFPGHYIDEETGLCYNRFRYYDPVLGRYLESGRDGIGGGLNLYAYTSNPLVEVDVWGLGGY